MSISIGHFGKLPNFMTRFHTFPNKHEHYPTCLLQSSEGPIQTWSATESSRCAVSFPSLGVDVSRNPTLGFFSISFITSASLQKGQHTKLITPNNYLNILCFFLLESNTFKRASHCPCVFLHCSLSLNFYPSDAFHNAVWLIGIHIMAY